jgi:hypothetical protein
MTWNDEDDDSADDPGIEDPDQADMNDEPAEVICPYCKREILEDSPQCPYCGSYVSAEDAPHRREWWWIVALVLLVLLLFVYVLRR